MIRRSRQAPRKYLMIPSPMRACYTARQITDSRQLGLSRSSSGDCAITPSGPRYRERSAPCELWTTDRTHGAAPQAVAATRLPARRAGLWVPFAAIRFFFEMQRRDPVLLQIYRVVHD